MKWKNNGGNKTIRSFYKHGTHIFHHADWFKHHTILTYEAETDSDRVMELFINNRK